MTRERKLGLIWKHTHPDFRGKREDGTKCVLVLREGGTHSVPLDDLTDTEIDAKLPYAVLKEGQKGGTRESPEVGS